MKLKHIYRIRISDDELEAIKMLHEHGIKPSEFIRKALQERIERDMPEVKRIFDKKRESEDCPF